MSDDLVQRLRDPYVVINYGDRHAAADRIKADRAAMQQALEALESLDGAIAALLGSLLLEPQPDAPGAKVRASIAALRERLK